MIIINHKTSKYKRLKVTFKHYMVYVIMNNCIREKLIHIQKLFQEFGKDCVLRFE